MRASRQFGPFQLEEVLGAGGMGAVYRALDSKLNRRVALKLLRKEYSANPEFVEQFQQEAAITATVNHPHVVRVFTTGEDHGQLYIAMELVDKGSLDDLMTVQGKVAESQVLDIGIQIAMGLEAAHHKGLIHRDIKPGNILFADARTSKIVDFGLAVFQNQAGKLGGEIWGTPYYVAPEKLDNGVEDHRSDMYSLGATLFHALAGRPPFEAETASIVVLKHLKSQAVSIQSFAPEVSSATAFVINRMLAKEQDKRYATYAECIEHLKYAKNQLMSGRGRRPQVKVDTDESGGAMTWVTFGVVALMVLGGIAVYTNRDQIFKQSSLPDASTPRSKEQRIENPEPVYQETRRMLLSGRHAEAEAAFSKLASAPDMEQPLQSWAELHVGLALLLQGKEESAREAFAVMQKRGLFSYDPADKQLAVFLNLAAYKLTASKPIPRGEVRTIDGNTYQGIAFLLFGLKNWAMGDYQQASALFRDFDDAKFDESSRWLQDYKVFVKPYLAEMAIYRTVQDQVKSKGSTAERRAALTTAQEARGRLKLKTKLGVELDEMIAKFEETLKADEAESQKQMADQIEADKKAMADAKTQSAALVSQMKYGEAVKMLQNLIVVGEPAKAEQMVMIKRVDYLAKFKEFLVQDLGSTGYTGPLKRRNGAGLPPGTLRGSDLRLDIYTSYGAVQVEWPDVAMESIVAAARSFLKGRDADEKKWLLGVYLIANGRDADGRTLLTEAASQRDDLAADLGLFIPDAAVPPSTPN